MHFTFPDRHTVAKATAGVLCAACLYGAALAAHDPLCERRQNYYCVQNAGSPARVLRYAEHPDPIDKPEPTLRIMRTFAAVTSSTNVDARTSTIVG